MKAGSVADDWKIKGFPTSFVTNRFQETILFDTTPVKY